MRVCGYTFSKDTPSEQTRLLGYAHHRTTALYGGEMHFHPYCEILFVLSGVGVFLQDDKEIAIQRGNLIIVNPYRQHIECSASESVPLDCVFFTLENFMFCTPASDATQLNDMESDNELPAQSEKILLYDFSDCMQLFSDAVRTFERELSERPPRFEAYLNNLFNNLLIVVLRKTSLAKVPQTIQNSKGVQLPVAMAQYLDSYYMLDISLDTLAKHFYVNKYYLAHAFKKTYGKSPMQYLNYARVREAMSMLQSTDYSVTAVAGLVGFVNASHFAKVFKRYTGRSPSDIAKAKYKQRPKE